MYKYRYDLTSFLRSCLWKVKSWWATQHSEVGRETEGRGDEESGSKSEEQEGKAPRVCERRGREGEKFRLPCFLLLELGC